MSSPTRSEPTTSPALSEMLELEQLDTNLFRSRVNQINRNRSLFGGQILGQALQAAALTVEGGRAAHSLHGYFLLAGTSDIPVIYDVELTRNGGSFSTRRVVARQRAKPIFHMELSFHRQEHGFEHDIDLDIKVPDPDDLLNLGELAHKFAEQLPQEATIYFQRQMVEIKPVSPEDFFMRKSSSTRGLYWIRSVSKLPDDPLTQMAAFAYLSDYFLASTVLLKHTVSVTSGEVMMASLDHAMWFHRPARADEWVLFDTLSPFAGGARGFTRGQIFDRNRKLISSIAQEALIRPVKRKEE
jgi:acyl-CoA thioesterase II